MKKTPLYANHVALGAKMAPFGGFDMPIQYAGIIAEHVATRSQVTIFDTCHMGEFMVSGPSACADLNRIFTCDVAALKPGRCRNGFMCNEQGAVIDDLIVYKFTEDNLMVVVNAGTQDADFSWITSHLSATTVIENVSEVTGKIDLQGAGAPRLLAKLVTISLKDFKPYTHQECSCNGFTVLLSRTGYTGEMGFEIYCAAKEVDAIWNNLLEGGAQPAGLGARDTLRLEVCYPLYGHELSEKRNVAHAGFDKLIALDKEFIGSEAIKKALPAHEKLCALELTDRRAARDGDVVLDANATPAGVITSGSFSPTLGKAIALAYVQSALSAVGTVLSIRTTRGDLPATVVEKPFYKNGTNRATIEEFL